MLSSAGTSQIPDDISPVAFLRESAWGYQFAGRRAGTTWVESFGTDGLGKAISEHSPLPAYCAAKPLSAYVIALLASHGLLDLCATVESLLPEVRGTTLGKVTVRDLLTHRAGLWLPAFELYRLPPTDHLTALTTAVDSKRMESYSEVGAWYVLGLIVERLGGVRLNDAIANYLLARAGVGSGVAFPWVHSDQVAEQFVNVDLRYSEPIPMIGETVGPYATDFNPGAGIRCSALAMVRIFDYLDGSSADKSANEVEASRTVLRSSGVRYDTVFKHHAEYGHGILRQLVTFGFPESVRHGAWGTLGHNCSYFALRDTRRDITVAAAIVGMPEATIALARMRRIVRSSYRFLMFVS